MSGEKRTALVLGATGLIGNEVMRTLINNEHYEKIYILSRRPLTIENKKIEVVITDFDKIEDFSNAFKVDDVYSCLGTTIKKAKTKENFKKVDYDYTVKAAQLSMNQQVSQFLVISAMGANSKSNVFYNRVKGETEEALKDIGLASVHIFRPSLLLGNREEFRVGEKLAEWMTKPIKPIMVGFFKKYRPIEAKIVASAMVKAALQEKKGMNIYESDQIEALK